MWKSVANAGIEPPASGYLDQRYMSYRGQVKIKESDFCRKQAVLRKTNNLTGDNLRSVKMERYTIEQGIFTVEQHVKNNKSQATKSRTNALTSSTVKRIIENSGTGSIGKFKHTSRPKASGSNVNTVHKSLGESPTTSIRCHEQ